MAEGLGVRIPGLLRPSRSLVLAVPLALAPLAGCDSQADRQAREEARRQACADKICEGDAVPRVGSEETVFKVNHQWFAAPRTYAGYGAYFTFLWPTEDEPVRVVILMNSAFVRKYPRDYHFLELAASKGWIDSRETVRPGLERIRMKTMTVPGWGNLNWNTYYVATDRRFMDGQPAVAGCSHDHPQNQGGAGFLWRPGISVGVVLGNQSACAHWPEIYQQVLAILGQIRPIPTAITPAPTTAPR